MSEVQNGSLPQARVKVKHPYLSMMGLYLGGFTGMYSETALNIALPQLSTSLGVELGVVQWLVVAYMLAIGIVLPFSSLIMKWFSARKITLFALMAFFLGALVSGFSSTFAVTLAGRIVQGVGTGLLLPLMFSMTMEVIPPHKIGAAMGVNALVIMSASAIGPTLAGILIGALSWHWVFFSFAISLVVGMFFTVKYQANPYELVKPRIDALSVVTSCFGFGGLVLGVGMASLYGWGSAPTLVSLVVGVVALVVYVRRQLSMETPVIDLRIFKIPGFRVGSMCVMLNFAVTLAAMYILPQFYQQSMLLTVGVAGMVMLPGGIVNALMSMFAGRIYDKCGVRIPARCGFLLSIVACILLMFTTPTSSPSYVVMCHILLMIGVPLAMSPCQTHALSSLPPRLSTDGSSMINTMQQVMGAIATAVATYLVSAGASASTAADASVSFAQGAHWGFVFPLVLAIVSLVMSFGFKKVPAQASEEHVGQKVESVAAEREQDGRVSVADLMEREVFSVPQDANALDALHLFASKKISGAPVVDGKGAVCGFLSDGDIIGTLARQTPKFSSFYAYTLESEGSEFAQKADELAAMDVMRIATPNVISVNVSDDMRDVCALLTQHRLKKAPVMDGARMVGIISRSDITRYTVGLYGKAE